MTLFGLEWSAGALWLATALVLIVAELLAPGFFLIFLGVGAAATGLLALIVPGLPPVALALVFAGITGTAVAVGWRWYRGSDQGSTDPLLNDRTARLIGRTVEVSDAIVSGMGRVRVGDGAWNATGPDMPAGAAARVVGASGSVLRVEPA